MEVVEKSIEKPTSRDAEESNESATETPSVGGSGGKESSNSESSSAGEGRGGKAVSGTICGEAIGKDCARARRLGDGGGEDSAPLRAPNNKFSRFTFLISQIDLSG